jgi:pimeloyl-ACP methyl ester carboxylesterase
MTLPIRSFELVLALALGSAVAGCASGPDESEGSRSETTSPRSDHVLVLHGFGPTAHIVAPLAEYLAEQGFQAAVFEYESSTESFWVGADSLRTRLAEMDADPAVRRIHIVGHSMGGIVTRAALAQSVPRKIGRVVMIASPNSGAPRADFFAPLLGWWLEPLRELGTGTDSAVAALPPVSGFEVGVLAGARDWTVPIESTRVEGAADWLVLDNGRVGATHTGLALANDEARRQIVFFLDHGRFDHPPTQRAE